MSAAKQARNYERAPRPRRLGAVALLALALLGCKSAPGGRSEATTSPRPAEPLSMRSPEQLGSPAAAHPPLGSLRPVTAAVPEERASAQRAAAEPVEPPALLRVVEGAKGRPHALQEGALVLPGGLVIRRVPKGVSVRIVPELQTGEPVWEIVDARMRRLALLKARSWSRVAAQQNPALLSASSTVRAETRRTTWGREPVRVVTDRFRSDTHVYTLERRATGTDWIWSGLELTR